MCVIQNNVVYIINEAHTHTERHKHTHLDMLALLNRPREMLNVVFLLVGKLRMLHTNSTFNGVYTHHDTLQVFEVAFVRHDDVALTQSEGAELLRCSPRLGARLNQVREDLASIRGTVARRAHEFRLFLQRGLRHLVAAVDKTQAEREGGREGERERAHTGARGRKMG